MLVKSKLIKPNCWQTEMQMLIHKRGMNIHFASWHVCFCRNSVCSHIYTVSSFKMQPDSNLTAAFQLVAPRKSSIPCLIDFTVTIKASLFISSELLSDIMNNQDLSLLRQINNPQHLRKLVKLNYLSSLVWDVLPHCHADLLLCEHPWLSTDSWSQMIKNWHNSTHEASQNSRELNKK